MPKKKTQEEYTEELSIKNPNLEVVDIYVSANTPILHRCLRHDVVWKTTPSRALSGIGCESCRIEKYRKSRLKSNEQYVREVALVNPDIEVVEEYIDATTPINHYCKKHEILWKALPSNILSGHGCFECGKEKIGDKNRKQSEQYIVEVAIKNPNIEVVGDYIDSETPIIHRCKIDEYLWLARPHNILSGKGCPKCAGNILLTNEEYLENLSIVNPNIKPLERYINAKTPILHQCLVDDYIWSTIPSSTLSGYGCPKCAGNIKKTNDEYVQELHIYNLDIESIEPYVNSRIPILHRCKKCGHIWKIAPSNVLSGYGCPQCQESRGEGCVRIWLEKHNIAYMYQKTFDDCRCKKVLPFDFYLPGFNVCIEYDGVQHFRPVDFAGRGDEWAQKQFDELQLRDKIKTEYCVSHEIPLLRISYLQNVEQELEKFLFI